MILDLAETMAINEEQQALQSKVPPAPEQPETLVSSIKPADTALKKST
jgi:hypothetical protein